MFKRRGSVIQLIHLHFVFYKEVMLSNLVVVLKHYQLFSGNTVNERNNWRVDIAVIKSICILRYDQYLTYYENNLYICMYYNNINII